MLKLHEKWGYVATALGENTTSLKFDSQESSKHMRHHGERDQVRIQLKWARWWPRQETRLTLEVLSDCERPKLAIQHNHSPPPDDTRSISEGKVSEHYWWGVGLPTWRWHPWQQQWAPLKPSQERATTTWDLHREQKLCLTHHFESQKWPPLRLLSGL
jgi:hypothetical protein